MAKKDAVITAPNILFLNNIRAERHPINKEMA
jgi:hypothetical protein